MGDVAHIVQTVEDQGVHQSLTAYSAAAQAHLAVSLVHPLLVVLAEVHQLKMVEHSACWEVQPVVGEVDHYQHMLLGAVDHSQGGLLGAVDHYLGGVLEAVDHSQAGLLGVVDHSQGGLQGVVDHSQSGGLGEEDHSQGELLGVVDHSQGGLLEVVGHQKLNPNHHCWQMEVSSDKIQAEHYRILAVHTPVENVEKSPTAEAVAVAPEILPAVMVEPDTPAVGCLPGGAACREEMVEIRRMEGAVVEQPETESLL